MSDTHEFILERIKIAIHNMEATSKYVEDIHSKADTIKKSELSDLFFELGLIDKYKSLDFNYEKIIRKLVKDHNNNANRATELWFETKRLKGQGGSL